MSNVACIPITQPSCQLTNTSEFMSQTHVQFMWALGKGQTERKFYILSTHQQATQKAQALEPVSRRACLLNPNQKSELLMNSDSKEPECNIITTEKKNVVRKFYWNQTCNGRVSAQCVLVCRLHSAQTLTSVPPFYRQKEWS